MTAAQAEWITGRWAIGGLVMGGCQNIPITIGDVDIDALADFDIIPDIVVNPVITDGDGIEIAADLLGESDLTKKE